MSTPNFMKRNASDYFVSECSDEWEYDDLVGNIQCALKVKSDKYDNERSYPGRIIGEIKKDFGLWKVNIDIIIRSGYYSGVNLDWDITIIKDSYADYGEYNYGDVKLPNYVQNYIDRKISKVEKVFKEFTDTYICAAVFSNGEAIYTKKSNN